MCSGLIISHEISITQSQLTYKKVRYIPQKRLKTYLFLCQFNVAGINHLKTSKTRRYNNINKQGFVFTSVDTGTNKYTTFWHLLSTPHLHSLPYFNIESYYTKTCYPSSKTLPRKNRGLDGMRREIVIFLAYGRHVGLEFSSQGFFRWRKLRHFRCYPNKLEVESKHKTCSVNIKFEALFLV